MRPNSTVGDLNDMSEDTTPPEDTTEAAYQRFSQFMGRWTTEHPPTTPAPQPRPQPQSSFNVEEAIETGLNRREARNNRNKRLEELETSNKTLTEEVEKLSKSIQKGARSVFSIFG